MKNLFCVFNLRRLTYNGGASKRARAIVILSGVRNERSRRIHDITVAANVRRDFKALDSSTTFVPHSAQNDNSICIRALQVLKTPMARRLRIASLALIAAIALNGCGKKSNPDAPFTTGNATDTNAASTNATDTNSATDTNATANAATDNNGAPTLKLATATIGAIDATFPATGTLKAFPNRETKITSATAGMLQSLPIRLGQKVGRGDVLAQLSTAQVQGQLTQAQAALQQSEVAVHQAQASAIQQEAQSSTGILQAQAQVSQAQASLQGDEATLINAHQTLSRSQALFGEGLIARKDVETAQLAVRTALAQVAAQERTIEAQRQNVAAARAASLQNAVKREDVKIARQQVEGARAALQTARNQLALYTIRAPISGTLTSVDVGPGATVDTTTPVATLTDLSRLQLSIAVPADSAVKVSVGQAVTFEVQTLPNRIFTTRIDALSNGIDATTGTLSAFATVYNTSGHFKDDSLTKVQIVTRHITAAVLVPQSAILSDPQTGETSVVVVGKDNVAHVRTVKVGLSQNGKTQITSGVKPNEKVAISGQYGVPDGTKVATV